MLLTQTWGASDAVATVATQTKTRQGLDITMGVLVVMALATPVSTGCVKFPPNKTVHISRLAVALFERRRLRCRFSPCYRGALCGA